MVEMDKRGIDKQKQLFRRINDITYCYINRSGDYAKYTIPMSEYIDYATLKRQATAADIPDWVKDAETAPEIDPPEPVQLDMDDEIPF